MGLTFSLSRVHLSAQPVLIVRLVAAQIGDCVDCGDTVGILIALRAAVDVVWGTAD